MGLQQDFLMRMIQQLTAAFARVFPGRSDPEEVEHPADAMAQLDAALAEAFGTRAELLDLQPDETIEELEPAIAAEAGRLLVARARLALRLGQPAVAQVSIRRAIRCLLAMPGYAFHGTEGDEELAGDLLVEVLRDPALTAGLDRPTMTRRWRDLFEHEASRQRFARAEDALFTALEIAEDPRDLWMRGERFYEALLELPDALIEAGGLTRDEVHGALEELRSARGA